MRVNFALALFVLPESRKGDAGARFDLDSLNPFKPLGWALTFTVTAAADGDLRDHELRRHHVRHGVGAVQPGHVRVERADDRAVTWRVRRRSMPGAQALLTGPAAARLGERWALVLGMACELTALVILGFATQGWILFALAPLFALGGIGMPALQSLTTRQVDADNQGKLQGVLASLVSLSAVFGPLFFSYVSLPDQADLARFDLDRRGAVYLLALPLLLGIRKTSIATVTPELRQS